MEAAASFNDVDNLKATELRLGLPGTDDDQQQQEEKTTTAAATAALLLPTPPPSTPTRGKKRDGEAAPPAAKAQVVGWPPVRSYRKSCFQQQQQASNKQQSSKQPAAAPAANKEDAAAAGGGGNTNSSSNATAAAALFVKVSMDGAPYLRKVDLKMYKGYRELREALEAMFLCCAAVNPSDFAVTYEDKDGDLMLVGDVPFDMFTSTCKRLRIMKGSEARGLGSPKSTTTN